MFRYSMIGNDLESYRTSVQNCGNVECTFAQNAFFFR
mgnify:CR=1 FL=1